MEKVRALREKDTEIRRLQQQMHQLEVGNVHKIPMQTYNGGYNVLALILGRFSMYIGCR